MQFVNARDLISNRPIIMDSRLTIANNSIHETANHARRISDKILKKFIKQISQILLWSVFQTWFNNKGNIWFLPLLW
jgi:hypothetical protein